MSGWLSCDPCWGKHGIVLEPEPPKLPNPIEGKTPKSTSKSNPSLEAKAFSKLKKRRTAGRKKSTKNIRNSNRKFGMRPTLHTRRIYCLRPYREKPNQEIKRHRLRQRDRIGRLATRLYAFDSRFGIWNLHTLLDSISIPNISEEPWMESKEASGSDLGEGHTYYVFVSEIEVYSTDTNGDPWDSGQTARTQNTVFSGRKPRFKA